MSTPIAAARLRFDVALAPGERILWEGGPHRRAAWSKCARFSGFLALAAAWPAFVLLVFLGEIGSAGAFATELATDPAERAAQMRTNAEFAEASSRVAGNLVRYAVLAIGSLGLLVLFAASVWARKAWYVVTTSRVFVQGGLFGTTLTTIGLDRVVAVAAGTTLADELLGVHDVALAHAGIGVHGGGALVLAGLPRDDTLLMHLVSEWLPRDGRGTAG